VTSGQLAEWALLATAGAIVLAVACAFIVAFALMVRDDVVPAIRELARWARRRRRRS
jgi:hypothetical protein